MVNGPHDKGKRIVAELGKYGGRKIITYEMSDFIGGMRHIPRLTRGSFEMQDNKVVNVKHFNICRLLGRKGIGFVIVKQEDKLFGFTLREGKMKPMKDEDVSIKLLAISSALSSS